MTDVLMSRGSKYGAFLQLYEYIFILRLMGCINVLWASVGGRDRSWDQWVDTMLKCYDGELFGTLLL